MNEEIISNLNERLDRAIEQGRTLLADEQLQYRVEEWKHKAEETIRKHPVKSVIVGVTVGFILGKMLSSDD